jgi:hypothetical protein
MRIKQRVAATLVAGAIGLSTLGLGTGVASANTPPGADAAHTAVTDQTTTQPVDWRGHGGGYGHRGPGFGYGYGYGPGYYPGWHPWGFRPWGWHHW